MSCAKPEIVEAIGDISFDSFGKGKQVVISEVTTFCTYPDQARSHGVRPFSTTLTTVTTCSQDRSSQTLTIDAHTLHLQAMLFSV